MCLTVGGAVVRRGKRLLRRHLGEETKPSREERLFVNQGSLLITSAVVLVLCKLYHGCSP